jgi:hypothetical protein
VSDFLYFPLLYITYDCFFVNIQLPEFCSRDGSLVVKEIFGVTDEDADSIRIHILSETSDIESLEKMVDDSELGHGPSPLS